MATFKDKLLAGKTAFVAGASSGINLQIATRLAEAGAAVTVLSRSPDKIEAAAAGIRAKGGTCIGIAQDVRDHDGVGAAFATSVAAHGEIDILVSGAAGNFVAPFNGISYNGFRAVIDIDLVGLYNVMRQGFPHLRKPGAACITISAPQSIHPYPLQAHVNAAKAGADMLVKTLAVEWGP
ncbi:MAG: SDR family NAD(P)-dependent oxidoreductase, partial [Hyphomonadaceae bacterium]